MLTVTEIARVCHEANRALCEAVGDDSQLPWGAADDWQRESAIKGVQFAIANPSATPEDQHAAWMHDKQADGWRWGVFKDAGQKTHPCLVAYRDLPLEQRAKDHVFRALVEVLSAPL